MGLQAAIQAATQAAFNPINDLLTAATYVVTSDQDDNYDPESGEVSDNTDSYSINVLLTDIQASEFETAKEMKLTKDPNLLLNNTKKVMIPTLDLTPTPKVEDQITIEDVNWEVFRVAQDPAGALWELYIRKP